jgi:hypothetical protein
MLTSLHTRQRNQRMGKADKGGKRSKPTVGGTKFTHCAYTVLTLFLHCSCIVLTLFLHCSCTVLTLLLHCCPTVVPLGVVYPVLASGKTASQTTGRAVLAASVIATAPAVAKRILEDKTFFTTYTERQIEVWCGVLVVCVYVSLSVSIYLYMRVCIIMCVSVCVLVLVCVSVCVCVCIHAYMSTRSYPCIIPATLLSS